MTKKIKKEKTQKEKIDRLVQIIVKRISGENAGFILSALQTVKMIVLQDSILNIYDDVDVDKFVNMEHKQSEIVVDFLGRLKKEKVINNKVK